MSDTGDERRLAKANVAAEKARLKSMRPWYKKKRFIIPLAFVALIVVGSLAGGGGDDNDAQPLGGSDSTAQGGKVEEERLYADRPDAQREDQERQIGQGATLSGYTATVTAAAYQRQICDFERDGYLVVDVTILNRDDKAQSYSQFDWKLQHPDGQVHDPDFATIDGLLSTADLVPGGQVAGKLVFEIGQKKGDFYVIYKPDAFDAARGIWKVTA